MHIGPPLHLTHFDNYERDAQGHLIVSSNNKENDIAFFFYKADALLQEASIVIQSSLLTEELQQKAFKILNQELSKCKEEASSKARSDRDKYQIRHSILYEFNEEGRNLEDGMKKEWKEVRYAIGEVISRMVQGDAVFPFLQEQIRRHQEKRQEKKI